MWHQKQLLCTKALTKQMHVESSLKELIDVEECREAGKEFQVRGPSPLKRSICPRAASLGIACVQQQDECSQRIFWSSDDDDDYGILYALCCNMKAVVF